IITAAADIISGSLTVVEPLWGEVFNLGTESSADHMGQGAFTGESGSSAAAVMSLGFRRNVLRASFTPLKSIHLRGHTILWTTAVVAGIAVQSAPDVGFWQLVIVLSIIMGLYWTLQPAIVQPFMRKVTGNDEIALGHTSASVSLLAALMGKWF